MALNLAGLLPRTGLPMAACGEFDEPRLRRNARWTAGQAPVTIPSAEIRIHYHAMAELYSCAPVAA